MEGIYHPAVLVSALVDYMLGWLWFGVFFPGIRETTHDPVPAIVAAAMSLALAYVIAILLNMTGRGGVGRGVQLGVLLAIGVVATTLLENTLYEGRGVRYWLIDAGYAVAGITAMAAIIGAWKPEKV